MINNDLNPFSILRIKYGPNIEDVQKKEKKKGDSEEKEDGDQYNSEEEEGDELIYEKEDNDEYISEEKDGDKYISEEYSDDNDNSPSDLTIDHRPSRDCEYFFDQERVLGEATEDLGRKFRTKEKKEKIWDAALYRQLKSKRNDCNEIYDKMQELNKRIKRNQ
ncbi:unnamed protein product [Mucor hiemalis]